MTTDHSDRRQSTTRAVCDASPQPRRATAKRSRRALRAGAGAIAVLLPLSLLTHPEAANADPTTPPESPTPTQAGAFVPHGSRFGKTETVIVRTDPTGAVQDVSVRNWLKNPDGKLKIEDVSTLTGIEVESDNVTLSQQGSDLVWLTGGQDVSYRGTATEDPPVGVSISYQLDGKPVTATDLAGVTGTVKITIDHHNRTRATVKTRTGKHTISRPFLMVSAVMLDAAHATDVTVDGGTVIDNPGSFLAVGMGMPGLAESLDLTDQLDLPEQVIVTARVKDFDAPGIITIATSSLLDSIDLEGVSTADSGNKDVDEALAAVDSLAEGVSGLEAGTSQLAGAMSKIKQGQAQLTAAMPGVSNGLGKLAEVSGDLKSDLGQAITEFGGLYADAQAIGENNAAALEALAGLDTSGLTPEQVSALEAATEALKDSNSNLASLGTSLGSPDPAGPSGLALLLGRSSARAAGLNSGLNAATDGFRKLNDGSAELAKATAKVSAAMKKVATGVSGFDSELQSALTQVKETVDTKLDLVRAIQEHNLSAGAFSGNASDMPASTTFMFLTGV